MNGNIEYLLERINKMANGYLIVDIIYEDEEE